MSDLKLWKKQNKMHGLKLISPQTVMSNYFQWALTFLRLIRLLAVTFHKGTIIIQARSTCFLHTVS